MVLLVALLAPHTWAQDKQAWEKVSDGDGMVAYMRIKPGTSIYEGKAIGVIHSSMAAIEAVIRDPESMKDYGYCISESCLANLPGIEQSKDTLYTYVKINMPWPVKDRDCVAVVNFSIDPQTGTLFVHGENIKSTYRLSPDIIRTPVNIVNYTIVPKDSNTAEVTVEGCLDPGGDLPVGVVNLIARFGTTMTFKNIRKLAMSEKFRKASGVVTTTVAVK